MKRLLIICLVLLISASLFGQYNRSYIKRYDITVTLDSTESEILYIPWPAPDFIFVNSDPGIYTSLDSLDAPAIHEFYETTGGMFIHIIPEYITAEESDSFLSYIKPLTYDPNKLKWYTSKNDSTFLYYGKGIYTAASATMLDWDNGECYTVDLGGETWRCAGIALYLQQYAYDTATADTKFYIVVYIRR